MRTQYSGLKERRKTEVMEAWYIAKTRPSKERVVETYLTEGQGIEVFLPLIRPARQRCQVLLQILGRLAKVEVPAEILEDKSPYRGLAFAT